MDRVLLSAGEASGDAYGAALVHRLRAWRPSLRFAAVGGRRLAVAGVPLVADCSRWGAVGIVEALRVGPRVLRGYLRAKRVLRCDPGLFVPIDYGFINVRLARHAKAKGWRVLYFVPPGSWRKDKQGADLPAITDAIVTPFSWSADILSSMGARAYWFGHPLKELIGTSDETRLPHRLAALPGSRAHEIDRNLPAIARSLPREATEVEFAVAPNADPQQMRRTWERIRPDIPAIFTVGDTYGVLRRARSTIVCSGTATLEAALCRCPCVVIYLGSKLMEIEYRIRKPRFDFIALPNILLGRAVVPELIQWDATPERVAAEVRRIWLEGPEREAQLAAFAEIDAELGPGDAIKRTAQLASEMLEGAAGILSPPCP